LDAELAELPERRLRTHLERCERCAGRIATIAAESRTVARYLAAAEVAGPDEVGRARALAAARRASATREGERRGGSRSAAAAAVPPLVAVAAAPVREGVADRWDALRDHPSGADDVVTLVPALVYRSSVVAFAPRGATFELHIERAQVEGSVTVEVREAERA